VSIVVPDSAYGKGYAALGLLAEEEGSEQLSLDRNEATTRLQLINRIIIDGLTWPPNRVMAEDRLDKTYADYVIGVRRQAIIEAKREGVSFQLPVGMPGGQHPLPALLNASAAIKDAIEQVAGYCAERGIGIGAVSNGHQLIAFLGSRDDGVAPLQGKALVFTSLDDMHARFRELWEALSPAGLESGRLKAQLHHDNAAPPPIKLSGTLSHYPGYRSRNPLNTELKILGGLFIEDLASTSEDEDDFLKSCYCASGALSQYAEISKTILTTRYSSLLGNAVEAELQSAATEKHGGVNPTLKGNLVAAGLASSPIILVGDVGVGKSIFIRHLLRIDARDALADSIILTVDFGAEPALATDVQRFVARRFTSQLRDDFAIDIEDGAFVRAVYNGDLNRLSKGIYADLRTRDPDRYADQEIELLGSKIGEQEAHLRRSLEHLVLTQKKQVLVVLDNVDQRPFEFQEGVFLIAQNLAQTWPATVFVSLRPDTFYRSKREGYLAAYQPRAFTIAPPRVDRVLDRRLAYGQRQVHATGRLPSWPSGMTVNAPTLEKYLSVLHQSFRADSGPMSLVDNLSAGNVRLALEFIATFVGSGHVDTRKILDIVERTGRYIIAPHEFLRAVLYGDFEHFDPTASPLANLFDISEADGGEHFLLPALIGYVDFRGEQAANEGYVLVGDMFSFGQEAGFDVTQIEFAIDRAVDKRLLEGNPAIEPEASDRYRVTSAGVYTARHLVESFSYVDAMIVDTPIVDVRARTEISDVRAIGDRLDRMGRFRAYLDNQWDIGGDGFGGGFDWPKHSASIEAERREIAKRVGISGVSVESLDQDQGTSTATARLNTSQGTTP
jgi:hypothetical protein